MRVQEKQRACDLRRQGWSLREISKELNCSKGSVSNWIKDISLTKEQIANLKSSQDKGRAKAANHPNSPKYKWQQIRSTAILQAQREIPKQCSLDILKLICTALYWAEGYKESRALFVFANTDPAMIRLMMDFLCRVCKVPKNKFRGRVNIYPGLNVELAQNYWSKISGIPEEQFHKPLLAISRASSGKRKNLPYGTFRIIISDVILCSQIHGWISGLKNWASSSAG